MKKLLAAVMLVATGLAFCPAANAAGEKVSTEECIAFVKKAVAFIEANGKEKALAEFSNTNGQFVKGSLYIFAYDLNGVSLAIGNGNAGKMVGKNLIDMKDAEGVPLVKGMSEVAKTKGRGWYDYHWPNPVTKTVEAKSSYIEKVGDYFVGSGIYK